MGKKIQSPEANIRIDNQTKITNLEDINVPLFKEKATKVSFTFQDNIQDRQENNRRN